MFSSLINMRVVKTKCFKNRSWTVWCRIKNTIIEILIAWAFSNKLCFILKVRQPHFRFASIYRFLTWRKADREQHKHRKPVVIILREQAWASHIHPGHRDLLQHHHYILTCMFVYIQVTLAEGAGEANTTAPRTVSWACAQSTGGSVLVTMGVASEPSHEWCWVFK